MPRKRKPINALLQPTAPIRQIPTTGVLGAGQAGEWKIRRMAMFDTCFYCKGLVKKGERVYAKPRLQGPDLICHIAHGNPADWNLT